MGNPLDGGRRRIERIALDLSRRHTFATLGAFDRHVCRSFYWRIAISFIVLVVLVLAAQATIFALIMTRSGGTPPPVYVLLKGGEVLSSRPTPVEAATRQLVADTVSGARGRALPATPLYRDGTVVGAFVLAPMPGNTLRPNFMRLALPNTIVLALAAALAAFVIFSPARRRLHELEAAAEQLGGGDLTARASERGRDEIAHVAATFNRMATELGARDELLRTSDRRRRQMLADVSHELKTPLTAMRGYVESLRMEDATFDPEKRERYFATLEAETLRLERIVKDLLDLGRLEDAAMTLNWRLFAIERVFERVVARHEVDALARQLTFHVSIDEEADQMIGDPDRIEQVVENLVANALRYAPEGGGIALQAAAIPGAMQISVIDNGEGIPSEHFPHIFERFYKADSSRTGSSGSGLGLSIAKAIVERHGGRISADSSAGETAFVFTIPQG